MDEVLRQNDPDFLQFLNNMRNGTLEENDVQFVYSRCLDKLSPTKKLLFSNNTIYLVPQWKQTHDIVFQYLQSFNAPVAKIKAIFNSMQTNSGKSYCVRETSLPLRVAICKGAVVMLLKNFVVEYKLMNGSIGVVRKIVYRDSAGPSNHLSQPAYVIVEFPSSEIPESDKYFDDYPSTWIQIPVVEERCEKKCFSITMIPLKICIAITIHK